MSETVNWGILGTATIARKCVIPAIQAAPGCRVQVLGSRRPEAARDVARQHHIDRLVDGYEAVISDPEVTAVYIPLPNHLHHEWTLKALSSGKHVLCEKPIACNAREADEMAAAARQADKLLMEGFMYRFHPRSRLLKQMVAEGRLGTLKLIRAAFCYRMEPPVLAAATNFRLQPEKGGGALMDVGCYGVSAARWFFGQEPIAVQALATHHTSGVDLQLVGSLKFAGGQLAVVEAGFVSALQQTYTLVGDRAAIELPHNAYIPWEKEAFFTLREFDQENGRTMSTPGADEYRHMVTHFADAIRGRTPLDFTPDESVRNMRVLDALAEAVRSGQTVRLDERKAPLRSDECDE